MTKKAFYRDHLTASVPVLLEGMAREWPAYQLWQNETYLREKAGEEIIHCEKAPRHKNEFAYFDKQFSKQKMTFNKFLSIVRDPNREFNLYFAEENVPKPIRGDIAEPWLGRDLLVPAKTAFWHGIGTVSLPHTDAEENFMCVLQGWKDFTIVSPFQRGLVYPGHRDATSEKKGFPQNYSPVNFDNPDYELFPNFKNAKVHKIRVENGNCLFLPSYWWHRVSSSPDETIAVSTWYHIHHQMGSLAHDFMEDD